jgi:hypothetical protein
VTNKWRFVVAKGDNNYVRCCPIGPFFSIVGTGIQQAWLVDLILFRSLPRGVEERKAEAVDLPLLVELSLCRLFHVRNR